MLNRLLLVQNVGQFDSSAPARHPFERLTLVYADNGRGKTTMTAILRSLSNNDPQPIIERHRLAATYPPKVIIECGGVAQNAIFENGSWNRTLPELVIFDDVFVDENIYSGLSVGSAHRQNLHELIIGSQGVSLNQQMQGFVARIEAHNTELRARAGAIPSGDLGGMTVDAFCALQPVPDIDSDIQEAERALAAAREQAPVRETRSFEMFALPSFDTNAIDLLLRHSLADLDTAASFRVQQHFSRLPRGSEAWVAEGMGRIAESPEGQSPDCPFCAQNMAASPVLAHYRAFFSEEYRNLIVATQNFAADIRRTHSSEAPLTFERSLRVATERRAFWVRFAEVPDISFDTTALGEDWRRAAEEVSAALSAKQAAPLERINLSPEARSAIAAYEARRQSALALGSELVAANAAISVIKEQAAAGNVQVREADLTRLRAVRARHTTSMTAFCNAYLAEKYAKVVTEQHRDQAREALEQQRRSIVPNYLNAINQYLGRFNAGFRLDQIQVTNTRGGPSCTYSLQINNVPVPVGSDAGTGPAFRNTLSAGDRNTLALAFFFARLDQDPDLARKVVVIDDPVSSLDDNRSVTTVQEIRRLLPRVAQIIILSHSKTFLCQTWESSDRTQRAALQVRRDGHASSTIDAWDVAADLVTEYDRRHEKLRTYVQTGVTGNLRDIAADIRPTLEYFCRVAYPADYPAGTLLGPFRDHCNRRLASNPIMGAADVDELRDLIDYGNLFHHDSNPRDYSTVAVVDVQLQGFVQRALAFCSRG